MGPITRVDNIFKKLVTSNSISEETKRSLKKVGNRPGVMRGHGSIPVNITKFLRTPFPIEYLWWLLL